MVKGDSLRDANGFVLEIPEDDRPLGTNGNFHVTENVTENRLSFIIGEIRSNRFVTIAELAQKLHVNRMTIRRDMEKIRQNNVVRRVGPDKGGHWEVIEKK